MNVRIVTVLAVLLLVLGGVVAYDALTSSMNPYLTVSQVTADPARFDGEIQILATASSWSFDDRGVMHLHITDGNATLAVEYAGMPPQGMQEGQQVVAIGTLGSGNTLQATRILTKCPSKYA